MVKAVACASAWSAVDEPYETAVTAYADAALGSDAFMRTFWSDIQPFVATGLINSLSAT